MSLREHQEFKDCVFFLSLASLTALFIAFSSVPASPQEKTEPLLEEKSSCIKCHQEIDDKNKKIVEEFKRSAMFTHGIDCSGCHGGDPTIEGIEAMSPEKGFIGVPERKKIPELCASCHAKPDKMLAFGSRIRTDQLELYKQSMHGRALFERGDTNVAVCSDCHNSHEVLSPKNPKSSVYKKNIPNTCNKCHGNKDLMSKYGINPDVVSDYMAGYHAFLVYNQEQLAAPVCSDCHGSHSATPPGIATIGEVCAYCHQATVEYFEESRHSKAYPKLGIKNCLNCHNQHRLERPTDNYFDPKAESGCVRCHPQGSPQAQKIAVINESIRKIAALEKNGRALVKETEEVTHLSMLEMKPKLDDIFTHLLAARAKQHTLNPDLVADEAKAATEIFSTIEKYARGLTDRARRVKIIVILLAATLAAYGIFLLIYRKAVLDRVYPWQRYGEDTD